MRLTHVEGAVLAPGPGLAAGEAVHAALSACFARVFAVAAPGLALPAGIERIASREGAAELEQVCVALASCKAHALLVARVDLPALEPRVALALAAGMPARDGPELVALERDAGLDLRLALFRADALAKLRGLRALGECAGALEVLRIPADWLGVSGGSARADASS